MLRAARLLQGLCFTLPHLAWLTDGRTQRPRVTEPFSSCSSFTDAVMIVFILFTMDLWLNLLQETWEVPSLSKFISRTYIILWLMITSFLFKNIIMAIMGEC